MKAIGWVLGIGLAVWALVAGVSYLSDGAARDYAAATSSPQVVQKQEGFNPWAAFFFGYMLGGMGESPSYREYRTVNNTYYRDNYRPSPTPPQNSGNWGDSGGDTNGVGDTWDSNESGSWFDDVGSWGSDWDSDNSGSWGSDSWDSDYGGSWGSSWDSYDSGSSWDSYDSGSWGSDWGSSDSGSWGD